MHFYNNIYRVWRKLKPKIKWKVACWNLSTLFKVHTAMAPSPTDPCLFTCDAARKRFLKHTMPKGGEAQDGICSSFSPVSKSHIDAPVFMLLSLHATTASPSPSPSPTISLCCIIFLQTLRENTSEKYLICNKLVIKDELKEIQFQKWLLRWW